MSEQIIRALGHIIPEDVTQQRDCIHIAVLPAVADAVLRPGQHVGITPFAANNVPIASTEVETIGIVDPYLRRPVMAGQKFFVYLYPGSITGLRHDWTHPALEGA